MVLLAVDDGAVVYLNGDEIARINMPAGPIDAGTFARRTVGDNDEGFYYRLPVAAQRVRQTETNVLAAEVHQASLTSSDLFFDLTGVPRRTHVGAIQVARSQVGSNNT